ncbi:MAG: cupin domain-containing protein [Limnochordia bacterium]
MAINVFNSSNVAPDTSERSFRKGAKLESNVLRDSFILVDSSNSGTKSLTFGKTVIYPGCRTGGHAHAEYEEIYYITRGTGIMEVDGERFTVREGDAFWVEPGKYHVTFNESPEPMEYVWVLNKQD